LRLNPSDSKKPVPAKSIDFGFQYFNIGALAAAQLGNEPSLLWFF